VRELTAASVERFLADYRAALGADDEGGPIGLAVSGGGDSLALLRLAIHAFRGRIAVATVDHGLRPEAHAEARRVAALCASLAVPHAILRPETPITLGNVSQKAREARYGALARWAASHGIPRVLTAHSRDDAAESFLMRAAHGSGIAGLALMPAETAIPHGAETGVRLVRPLLGWSRAELRAVAEAAGWPIADDPSNSDGKYDRARIRALIAASPDLPAGPLARTARNLAEAEEALRWLVEEAWVTRVEAEPHAIRIDAAQLPRELRRRLAARAIRTLRADPAWSGEGLDGLVDRLDAGRTATLAGVVARPGPPWRFAPAPPRHGQS